MSPAAIEPAVRLTDLRVCDPVLLDVIDSAMVLTRTEAPLAPAGPVTDAPAVPVGIVIGHEYVVWQPIISLV